MDKQAILEETTDVVEKTLDILENVDQQVVTVVKNNPVVLAGVAVVSLAAGAAGGYFVARKLLEPKYEKMLAKETADVQDFYARLNKAGPYATPEGAVKALRDDLEDVLDEEVLDEVIREEAAQAMRSYDKMFQGKVEVDETTAGMTLTKTSTGVELEDGSTAVVVEETTNIFVEGKALDRDFDFEAEAAKRTADKPYVITEDEFMENADDDTEIAGCTYYEADATLVDEADKVIDDIEGHVGENNLKKFGHGSNDRNLIYIRNEARGNIYEIARSTGSYMKEVLGMDDEDERPSRKRVRHGGDD